MSDAAALHAQQVAYWNGAGVKPWIARQAHMDARLVPVAEAAIALAAVKPGETVLDIGCGTGATSIALAAKVGPSGHVTGLDVSGPMIELARPRGAGIANLEWRQADASSEEFTPGGADLLFSRFGVMFFGDPTAAFTNLRRALRPGGRLVFACWRPFNENPWMLLPLQAVEMLVPPMPRPGPEEPGPFAFGDTARVVRILTGAGFAAPTFNRFDMAMQLGANLDEAAEQAATFGAAGRALQEQPADIVQAARAAIRVALEPHVTADGVALPGAIWLVEAFSK